MGLIKSNKILNKVVFPAPLLPTRPKLCPVGMSIDSTFKTSACPYFFEMVSIVIMVFFLRLDYASFPKALIIAYLSFMYFFSIKFMAYFFSNKLMIPTVATTIKPVL